MGKSLSGGAALGLALVLAAAGPVSAQSLSEVYAAALKRDPDHAAALADRAAARQNESLARALFRPKVQLQASGGASHISVEADNSASGIPHESEGASGSVILGAQQPLINGRYRAQARQLRAGVRAGEAEYEARLQQLAVGVSKAYFDVLKAADQVSSYEAQEASARREQQAAQRRFEEGWARITDVREAQARADGVAAQNVAARADYDLAVSDLYEMTGIEATNLFKVRTDLIPTAPALPLQHWLDEALAKAPILSVRQEQIVASRAAADEYRWGNQVDFALTATYGHLWRGGESAPLMGGIQVPDEGEAYFAGVQLKMPLYSGGALEAQRRQASLRADGALARLDAARRDVRLQVQQAWRGQTSRAEQIGALRTALASAELQERAALTGREVGSRTQSDVLAAQAQSFEIHRQLHSALYDYELSRIMLAAAVGGLTPDVLSEVDLDMIRP